MDVKFIQIDLKNLEQMNQKNRENEIQYFKDHPEIKMPVFIGRNNPKLKIHWK